MRYKFALPLVLLCTVVPAMAQPPAKACLTQINMWSFDPTPDNRALIVNTRDHQRYRVNFMGRCYNLQWHMGLRFKTFGTSNLSCVEKGDQVLMHDPVGPNACIIQSVEYQTPAMDRADAMAKAAGKRP